MAITPTQQEGIIMMKVKITSKIQKLNEEAQKLNLIQQRLTMLDKTVPTDSFGDVLTDAEITKFHGRTIAEFDKIFSVTPKS